MYVIMIYIKLYRIRRACLKNFFEIVGETDTLYGDVYKVASATDEELEKYDERLSPLMDERPVPKVSEGRRTEMIILLAFSFALFWVAAELGGSLGTVLLVIGGAALFYSLYLYITHSKVSRRAMEEFDYSAYAQMTLDLLLEHVRVMGMPDDSKIVEIIETEIGGDPKDKDMISTPYAVAVIERDGEKHLMLANEYCAYSIPVSHITEMRTVRKEYNVLFWERSDIIGEARAELCGMVPLKSWSGGDTFKADRYLSVTVSGESEPLEICFLPCDAELICRLTGIAPDGE